MGSLVPFPTGRTQNFILPSQLTTLLYRSSSEVHAAFILSFTLKGPKAFRRTLLGNPDPSTHSAFKSTSAHQLYAPPKQLQPTAWKLPTASSPAGAHEVIAISKACRKLVSATGTMPRTLLRPPRLPHKKSWFLDFRLAVAGRDPGGVPAMAVEVADACSVRVTLQLDIPQKLRQSGVGMPRLRRQSLVFFAGSSSTDRMNSRSPTE